MIDHRIKVSVIVAVYNAAQYLRRCLDSLKSQTMKDFNVIIVDDGSTDESLAICHEYVKSDNRFLVYHKENGGVSSTRQYGVDQLDGMGIYSIHVDPDDWVEPMMLERMYEKASETDADIVICDFYMDYNGNAIYLKQDPKTEDPHGVLHAVFGGLYGSLCNKLIKSDYYINGIRFPEGLNYCEDYLVIMALLLQAKRVIYLPEAFYHYDQFTNSKSETRTPDAEHINQTRMEVVRRGRLLMSVNMKTWHYYLFEINNAFDIIVRGNLSHSIMRSFFKDIPLTMLLHRQNHYLRTLIVVMNLYGYVPACFFSKIHKSYLFVKRMWYSRRK